MPMNIKELNQLMLEILCSFTCCNLGCNFYFILDFFQFSIVFLVVKLF